MLIKTVKIILWLCDFCLCTIISLSHSLMIELDFPPVFFLIGNTINILTLKFFSLMLYFVLFPKERFPETEILIQKGISVFKDVLILIANCFLWDLNYILLLQYLYNSSFWTASLFVSWVFSETNKDEHKLCQFVRQIFVLYYFHLYQ